MLYIKRYSSYRRVQTCCIRGVLFSFKVTDNPNKERPIFQV